MRTAFPVEELPARNALTVGVRCVNRTRKHAASATAYSVRLACPSIKRNTRSQSQSLPQRIEFGNEKGLKLQNWLRIYVFFQSVRAISSSRISCNRWSRRSWSAAAPPSLLCICVRFASLISAISSRSFLIRSDTNLGINTVYFGRTDRWQLQHPAQRKHARDRRPDGGTEVGWKARIEAHRGADLQSCSGTRAKRGTFIDYKDL